MYCLLWTVFSFFGWHPLACSIIVYCVEIWQQFYKSSVFTESTENVPLVYDSTTEELQPWSRMHLRGDEALNWSLVKKARRLNGIEELKQSFCICATCQWTNYQLWQNYICWLAFKLGLSQTWLTQGVVTRLQFHHPDSCWSVETSILLLSLVYFHNKTMHLLDAKWQCTL